MTDRTFRALLVCNWEYTDSDHQLQRLNGPRNDAACMREALTDEAFGLFGPDDVAVRENLTNDGLRDELFDFAHDASPDDVLLIYFSGHGERLLGQRLGLCGVDLQYSKRLTRCFNTTDLSNWLADLNRARSTIIVLDCCYSGGFKGSAVDEEIEASFGAGTVVLSSGGTQASKDAVTEDLPSPFTAALATILTDAALLGDEHGYLSALAAYEALGKVRPPLIPEPKLRGEVTGRLAIARRPQATGALKPLTGWRETQEIEVVDVVFDGSHLAEFDPLRQATIRRLSQLADGVARLPEFAEDDRLRQALRKTWSCVAANLFAAAAPTGLHDRLAAGLDPTGRQVLKLRLAFTPGAEDVEPYPWEYLGLDDASGFAGRSPEVPLALHRGLLVERVAQASRRRVDQRARTGTPSVAVVNAFPGELDLVGRRVAQELEGMEGMNLVASRHGADASWGGFLDALDQLPHYLVLCLPVRRIGRGAGELGFADPTGDGHDFWEASAILQQIRETELTFDGVVLVTFAAMPSRDAFRGVYDVASGFAADGLGPVVFVCHARGYEPYLQVPTNPTFPGSLLHAISYGKPFDRAFWYARSRVLARANAQQKDGFGVPGFYGPPAPAPRSAPPSGSRGAQPVSTSPRLVPRGRP